MEQADDKPDLVIQSLLPLRSRTAAGDLAPIDLALKDEATRFAPFQPLVELSVSKRLGDGVALGEHDIHIVPIGADSGAGVQVGESVVWANTATDTDTIARPLPTGVEFFSQLRSEQSPETVGFELELPVGASLKPATTGEQGAEIVRGDTVLARVGGVAAVDADGTPVRTTLTVDANKLRVAVPHRDADFAYPILVDPTLTDTTLVGTGSGLASGGPWDWTTSNNGFVPFAGSGYLGTGLYIRDLNNTVTVAGSDQGYWFYRSPGDSSIVTASFNPFKQDNPSGSGMCGYVGVLGSNLNWMRSPAMDCRDQFLGDNAIFNTSATEAGASHNAAIYGVAPATGVSSVHYFMDGLFGASITIQDDKTPTFNVEQAPPSGWTSNDAAIMRVRVSDSGLGVKHSEMRGPNGNLTPPHNPNCPTVACDGSDPIQAAVGSLPEGINTVTVTANDPIPANTSSLSPPITVRVDRSAPTVSYSGGVAEHDGGTLDGGVWSLSADAVDGARNGTAAQARSGVAKIEMLIDGSVADVQPQENCTGDSCPLSADFTIDAASLPSGTHSILVRTTDMVGGPGHYTERTFTVRTEQSQTTSSCSNNRAFTTYYFGNSFEALPVTFGIRGCDESDLFTGQRHAVTYVYGSCDALAAAEGDDGGGCRPPLQVDSAPLCERHAALYQQLDGTVEPHTDLVIKGVPAAAFAGDTTIEIYTGDTTIAISGDDAALVRRAADAVRPALVANVPGIGQEFSTLPLSDPLAGGAPALPPANQTTLSSTTPC